MTLSDQSALREAADWFARMRGPDAASSRQAFDRWLAVSEANRDAYSRVAETFSLGKHLAKSHIPETRAGSQSKRMVLLSATAVIMIAGISYLERSHSPDPRLVAQADLRTIRTRVGEIRTATVVDGSRITLDTGTELVADISPTRRDIRMTAGRARFDVAHDGRPFVVHVPDGAIVARGTLFDVRIADGRTQVNLLRGAIDVERMSREGRHREMRRLAPGQAVTFDTSRGIASPTRSDRPQILQPDWPDALLAFDRVNLRDLATEANRYSTARLIVSSDLASVPVSGTFRVGDAQRLADRLATLLDMDIVRQPKGNVELRPRTQATDQPAAADMH